MQRKPRPTTNSSKARVTDWGRVGAPGVWQSGRQVQVGALLKKRSPDLSGPLAGWLTGPPHQVRTGPPTSRKAATIFTDKQERGERRMYGRTGTGGQPSPPGHPAGRPPGLVHGTAHPACSARGPSFPHCSPKARRRSPLLVLVSPSACITHSRASSCCREGEGSEHATQSLRWRPVLSGAVRAFPVADCALIPSGGSHTCGTHVRPQATPQ